MRAEPLRILILGSSGGGGDWPPLVAAAVALTQAGHEIIYLADGGIANATAGSGLTIESVPPGLDLPSAIAAWKIESAQKPGVPLPLLGWAAATAPRAEQLAKSQAPDLLLCSDFTAPLGALVRSRTEIPMCIINAT